MPIPDLPYKDLADVAKNGSPMLLQAVGRAFGLGEAERSALGDGKIPGWFWAVLGVTAGVVVGIRVYKAHPGIVPGFVQGKGRASRR